VEKHARLHQCGMRFTPSDLSGSRHAACRERRVVECLQADDDGCAVSDDRDCDYADGLKTLRRTAVSASTQTRSESLSACSAMSLMLTCLNRGSRKAEFANPHSTAKPTSRAAWRQGQRGVEGWGSPILQRGTQAVTNRCHGCAGLRSDSHRSRHWDHWHDVFTSREARIGPQTRLTSGP
jgi:hypothetical protein